MHLSSPQNCKTILQAVKNNKSNQLFIEHMKKLLEMARPTLSTQDKLLYCLLNSLHQHSLSAETQKHLEEVNLIILLDKLSIHCALIFNLKVIEFNGLEKMQDEIHYEFDILQQRIEILLLGLEANSKAFIALALIFNEINQVLNQGAFSLSQIRVVLKQISQYIENYYLDLFKGLHQLQEQNFELRYLLSDLLYASFVK